MSGSTTLPFSVAFDMSYTASTIENRANMDSSAKTIPGHLLNAHCQNRPKWNAARDLPPAETEAKVPRIALGLFALRRHKSVRVERHRIRISLRVVQKIPRYGSMNKVPPNYDKWTYHIFTTTRVPFGRK